MACKGRSKCSGSIINAADLSERVAFQAVTRTPDGAGGYTEAWATVATVWASIRPVRSFEKFVAMQTETHVTHKIMCRYNAAITTSTRAVYNGRVFDITGVINVNEANAALEITAMEGVL